MSKSNLLSFVINYQPVKVPKEDYLMKYLEKLSYVIAAMLGFRNNNKPADAINLANENFMELLHYDVNELFELGIEKTTESIKNFGYSSKYLELIAQLSNETACSYQTMNEIIRAQSFYKMSLEVYNLLIVKDKTFSFEREMKIEEIKKHIN